MKKLEPEDFPEAKCWVDGHLPRSVVISQWLKVNLDCPDGYGTSEKAVCYVDKWPNPGIISGVDFVKSYGLDEFPKFCLFTIYQEGQFGKVEEFLKQLDKTIGILKSGGCEIKAISTDLRPLFNRFFDQNGLTCSVTAWPCRGYWIPPEERRSLQQHTILAPPGFEFDTLTFDDAPFLDSTWPLRVEGSSLAIMDRQICHFPTVCLRQSSDGKLACFEVMEAEIGLMSHLYTLPEYRRRGLATVVETKLSQALIRQGHIPAKAVVIGNKGGEGITTASPIWKCFGDIVWIRYGNEEMAKTYARVDHAM